MVVEHHVGRLRACLLTSPSEPMVHNLPTRQIRTIDQLRDSGWEIDNDILKTGAYTCCSDTVDASRHPSPFSSEIWSNSKNPLFHITVEHVPDQARSLYLYMNVRWEDNDEPRIPYDSNIRKLFDEGCIGVFGELEGDEGLKVTPFHLGDPTLSLTLLPLKDPDTTGEQAIEDRMELSHTTGNQAIEERKDVSDKTSNQAKGEAEAVLEARRLHNGRTKEFGLFILSEQRDSIIVNESAFRKGLLVGPLPDFAVLEVAGRILFWWGSKDAVYYIPQTEPQVSHLNISKDLADHLQSVEQSRDEAED